MATFEQRLEKAREFNRQIVVTGKASQIATKDMIKAGMSLNVLQEILGHDSPDTTLIYANIDNKTIEHEYRKYS